MAFCLVLGTQEFTSQLQGAENVTAQCQNCGNWSARCITRWPFFTICFIPLIPLATHKYKEVYCSICRFSQDLTMRPDVQGMIANGGGGPPQQAQAMHGAPQQGQYAGQGPNPGWNGQQSGVVAGVGQPGGYYGQGQQKPTYG